MSRLLESPFAAPVVALLILVVTNLLAYPYSHDMQMAYFWEHGPVENLTVAGYLACSAWLALLAIRRSSQRTFFTLSALVLLLPAARELDLHKAFTSDAISKSRYYLDPQIPLPEKLLAVAAILVALALLVSYARRYWRPLVAGVRRGSAAHLSTAIGIALLPVSKTLDTLPRLLRDFGFELGEAGKRVIGINEETLEMTLPLFFLFALVQYLRVRPTKNCPDGDS